VKEEKSEEKRKEKERKFEDDLELMVRFLNQIPQSIHTII